MARFPALKMLRSQQGVWRWFHKAEWADLALDNLWAFFENDSDFLTILFAFHHGIRIHDQRVKGLVDFIRNTRDKGDLHFKEWHWRPCFIRVIDKTDSRSPWECH